MKHLKKFDDFVLENSGLYENKQEQEPTEPVETIDPTVYENISERAFGLLERKEDAPAFAYGADDPLLQDLADLGQVNEDGTMVHIDKTLVEMMDMFNAHYKTNVPLPPLPKNLFEGLNDWFEENTENITAELFETQVITEMQMANDIDAILKKKEGTLTPEEFIKLSKARINARGADLSDPTKKEIYDAMHARWAAEVIAQKAAAPADRPENDQAVQDFYKNDRRGA